MILYKNQIYHNIKLLGKGKSGYSYLVQNNNGDQLVCKQIHHEPCHYYTFGDKLTAEVTAYHKLTEIGICLPKLIDINTEHEYLLKEYIDGETAAQQIANGNITDAIIQQMITIARRAYLYHINLDYFPTNFIITNNQIIYIDYELNPYSEEWNFENWGIYYWLNNIGMKRFLETGDHLAINHNNNTGKPLTKGMEQRRMQLIYF